MKDISNKPCYRRLSRPRITPEAEVERLEPEFAEIPAPAVLVQPQDGLDLAQLSLDRIKPYEIFKQDPWAALLSPRYLDCQSRSPLRTVLGPRSRQSLVIYTCIFNTRVTFAAQLGLGE